MIFGSITRTIGVVIAIVTLATGVGLMFTPDVATQVPGSMIVAEVAALLSVVLGAWLVRTRYNTETRDASIPDVERRMTYPTPGEEVDRLLYRMLNLREGLIEYRQEIEERVGDIARAILMTRFECSSEQAVEMLREGSWTDDPQAASFFSREEVEQGSLLAQLRERYTSKDPTYLRQLRALVAELEEVSAVPRPREHDADEAVDITSKDVLPSEPGERVSDSLWYRSYRSTNNWTGISAFAFLAITVGTLSTNPGLLLVGGLAIGIAGLSYVGTAPHLNELMVTRTVSDAEPNPGDELEVTVTVENDGETYIPDLRIADRLPHNMEVIDGSARLGTALPPGRKASFTYRTVVERGRHDWKTQILARDLLGTVQREGFVAPEGSDVTCLPHLRTVKEMPVRPQTSIYSGQVDTTSGGEGLEFFSIRDYQPGDSKRRIDWKTYAKTGEFSTIEFREENAARIVLLFDGREEAYVASGPGEKHSVDSAVDAAFDVFASLHDQGHLVGIAAFNSVPCWLGPSSGDLHTQRVRELFVDHPAIGSVPPEYAEHEVGQYVDPFTHVRRRLPQNTQIVMSSPLTDTYVYEVARRLDGAGHLVTVISPDPTGAGSVGQRIARLERSRLIHQLRDHNIPVLDYGKDRDISVEIEHAKQRSST